ncbi:hypothetical protein [Paenibacillus paridis]|uniref:hypothetical protein n=1 Tax=Paenibacillus paridis TaxID=2583376 RepID=UPI0011219A05|nr:hypothetical protein [Paenibacillus paridis]
MGKVTGQLINRERQKPQTVLAFNGEVPLSEQTLISNSRGLLGRIIMINAEPFPENVTSEKFDDYVEQSVQNCGHILDDWLFYLGTKNPAEITREVNEIF